MFSKLVISLFFILNLNLLINADQNGDYFRVPLEMREKNRPKRLVDDVSDPDMRALKNIQDKFFSIVGNSSLGSEFKNFNQLLTLVDSEAGIQIGRLILRGFMIGVGKENSNQLLTEFLDDFQYRLSSNFGNALLDYKDFLNTFDPKMIPLTMKMLFRKDELGNSLAQMPLGQLVDLIQPEASKYGIDVRSFINGIIGKGDSTFPDLVRKMISNFNISSLINTVSKSATEGMGEITPKSESNVEKRNPKKDQTLMLFKPLIAKLLKENEIDLEVDAVIQVLTPFVSGGGQYLQNLIPTSQGNGKEFNFAQLLPLVGLFSSQLKGSNKNSKNQEPNILDAALSLMGSLGNDNKNMEFILNLASQFLNTKKPNRDSKTKNKTPTKAQTENVEQPTVIKDSGIDMTTLLEMAQSLTSNSNNEDGPNVLSGLADQISQGSDIDTKKMIEMVSNLIGGIVKTKNDASKQATKTKIEKQKNKKSKTFTKALQHFLLRIQTDKKCHTKVKDAFNLGKNLILSEVGSLDEFKRRLSILLKPYKNEIEQDIDGLLLLFSYSQEEWEVFLKQVNNAQFREMIVVNSIQPATDVISVMASDDFQRKQNTVLKQKINEILQSFGMKGVTMNNFPERLAYMASVMSKGWDLPVDIGSLLEPLKYSSKETWSWYTDNMNRLKLLPRKEMEQIVEQSLEHDLANPLLSIWRIAGASKSSAKCLPRAVCDLVNDVTEDRTLQLLVARLTSIIYGGFKANSEDDFSLLIQVARAAVFEGDCQEYFPITCPKGYNFDDRDDEDFATIAKSDDNKHVEL